MIVGLFLPKNTHVERTIFLNVEPAVVFDEVVDFENFVTWNPWSMKDPTIKQWFEGEKISVGSKYLWHGNKQVGKGYMEITHIEANESVDMDLNFGPSGSAKCGFILVPKDGGTQLTWYFDSAMGNFPLKRIIGVLMDKFIGKDYSQGLENLAKKLNTKNHITQ